MGPAQIPVPSLVVLVGPSAAGKSTWADEHFRPEQIVSSDRLRAVVGVAEDDLDASDDAFALLDTIVQHRLRRRLTTVVDTLGLDADRRAQYRAWADEHGVPCLAVGFDVPADEVRARNRVRPHPIPAPALKQQLGRWADVREQLDHEGFAAVLRPEAVRHVAAHLAEAVAASPSPDEERATGVRFGLHVSAFPWDDLAAGLRQVATEAEAAGFHSLWVMDHVRQIPQVGRDWDPLLEPHAALSWMAAVTSHVRLGTLVTPVTFRNVGVLAKAVATLDVLSGGRATCGLGLGWYQREHEGYGLAFPAVGERYELLEDALEALPKLWGPGSKPYEGRRLQVPDTTCYPRPLQEHVPLLVGGGGEQRTLRLAARHADAINVMGTAAVVRHKVEVLHRHLDAEGRQPEDVRVTHLAPTVIAGDEQELHRVLERLRPRRVAPDAHRRLVNAGTVADQADRVHDLVAAGVQEVIVSVPNLAADDDRPLARWGEVIAAVT